MSVSLLLGLVYLISELLLTATRRSRSRTGTKQDRSTLRVVWLVIMVSVAAGIYVAKHWSAAALPHERSFAFAGVVLFVAGLLLRWWAIVTLGRFFTVDVTIEKDHGWSSADRFAWCVILPTPACSWRSRVSLCLWATGPRCLLYSCRLGRPLFTA
jgi:protein-S-isoprenylcysteine O-methyltransferase Ste14